MQSSNILVLFHYPDMRIIGSMVLFLTKGSTGLVIQVVK
jgi:hypothetical protein